MCPVCLDEVRLGQGDSIHVAASVSYRPPGLELLSEHDDACGHRAFLFPPATSPVVCRLRNYLQQRLDVKRTYLLCATSFTAPSTGLGRTLHSWPGPQGQRSFADPTRVHVLCFFPPCDPFKPSNRVFGRQNPVGHTSHMSHRLGGIPDWMLDSGFREVFLGIYVRRALVGVGLVKE